MPSDTTPEQAELRRKGRQRLIGAVTLALLAVVFVPMVLDPEPRRERPEPLLAIPPKEGAPPLAPVAAMPEPAAQRQGAAETAPATVSGDRKTVEPKAAEFKPAAPRGENAPAETKPVAADAKVPPPDQKPATQAPKLEGYAVQVGAFKDETKLLQAREKLAAAGIAHFTDRQPDFTRLRVGPFPTREAAEKAIAGVKRAGLDGRVVALP
jgi:DedD protein